MDPAALQKARARFTIDLHPSKLANVEEGVREHLNGLLLRNNDDLGGVLLSYSGEQVLTQQAHIHTYFPLVRLELKADVLLFRPKLGMRLVGIVNKVGADFVGLLVLGFINAAIAARQIRKDFQPHPLEQSWVSARQPSHKLEVGTQVHFTLSGVRQHGDFVSLSGSLLEAGTGAEGFARPPPAPARAPAAGAAPKQQQQKQAAQQKQQQQQQQAAQQKQQQQQQPAEKQPKQKQKKHKSGEGEGNAAGGREQQQQQAKPKQPAAAQVAAGAGPSGRPAETAGQGANGDKSGKQGKTPAASMPAANGGAPADGVQLSRKPKKRKHEAAAAAAAGATPEAAAAAAAGSVERQKKKKKKDKH